MLNKRGQTVEVGGLTKFLIVAGIFVGIIALWGLITGSWPWQAESFLGIDTLSQALNTLVGYEKVFDNGNLKFLNYIFGNVPQYLIDNTIGKEISAGIIMIGIWLMFFLIFSDIAVLFSTFRPFIGWIIGFVLTIMAANLKITTYLAVFVTAFTAGFGVLSVGVALVLMFILFLMFNFGSEAVRSWIVARKTSEIDMRARIGRTRMVEGAETAAALGRTSERAGRG